LGEEGILYYPALPFCGDSQKEPTTHFSRIDQAIHREHGAVLPKRMFMYQAVPFEDLPIFGSAPQWRRLQDLKRWAELQGLTLKRKVSKSDGTVTYFSHDEHGCITRIKQQP
jgi:hypothetical protein